MHLREAECVVVHLFTSSTVAAGLTTSAKWILVGTRVSWRFCFIIPYHSFKSCFIGLMALAAHCTIS